MRAASIVLRVLSWPKIVHGVFIALIRPKSMNARIQVITAWKDRLNQNNALADSIVKIRQNPFCVLPEHTAIKVCLKHLKDSVLSVD